MPLPADLDLISPDAQANYVEAAFRAGNPSLIVLALKEVGTLRRIPVALDESPRLSEVLRALMDLGLSVTLSNSPG